jgi:excisionase family DNA binding protein
MSDDTNSEAAPLELTTTTGPGVIGSTLTVGEAATRMGKAEKTVRRMLAKGDLEGAAKVPGPTGDTWQIPVAAVESYLARERAGHKQPGQVERQAQTASRVVELEAALAAAVEQAEQERAARVEERHQRELLEVRLAERERYLQTLEAVAARMLPAAPVKQRWWKRSKDTPPG